MRPPQRGDTPLHLAAQSQQLQCVRLLVERGADAKARNDDFKMPADMTRDAETRAVLSGGPATRPTSAPLAAMLAVSMLPPRAGAAAAAAASAAEPAAAAAEPALAAQA